MLDLTHFVYCPRCGIAALEDDEHDVKAMKCTECGYRYFHNTASSASGIIEVGNKVVLVVRAREPLIGKYGIPGGFVDYNESIEEALKREIWEELKVQAEITGYIGSFPNRYEYKRVVYHTVDVFFTCRRLDNDVYSPCEDVLDVKELAPESLPLDRFAFNSHVSAIKAYLRIKASG
jgi:ADP-ribose pyrophosphatase YjhB (NUDIX family)